MKQALLLVAVAVVASLNMEREPFRRVAEADTPWPVNGGVDNIRYSPLTQINTANVTKLTQAWSYRLQPEGRTLASASSAEIFRTCSTGLDGTPMPSYGDAIPDSEMWNLANYVYALQTHQGYYEPIKAEEIK